MRGEQDAPDPAIDGIAEDEDATQQDMPALTPSYDRAPPTIEEQISPFHPAARGRTAPGMAPPIDPDIRSKKPTAPGMAGLAAPTPRIVGAPELGFSDGPTDPDGHVAFGADGPTEPHGVEVRPGAFDPVTSSGGWDVPTDPDHPPPRFAPEVPDPGAPNVMISKSLEMQVAHFDDEAVTDPRQAPIVPAAKKRPPPGPTEVYLPALKRKQAPKEGSDWPLILGLGALALVILGVLAAVVIGVMTSVG